MLRARSAVLVAAALAVGGCSAMQDTFGGWFGGSPSPGADRDAPQGQTFYAAADDLPLHAEAAASSPVRAHLARGDELTRTRLERGYAFVIVEKSGAEGWVDNAQLDWRVPAAAAAPEKGSAVKGATGDAEKAPEPLAVSPTVEVPAVPTPTSTPAEVAPPPTIAPAPPASAPTRGAEPKTFDPY